MLSDITPIKRNQAMKNDLQKESLKQLLLAQKVQQLNKMGQGLGGLSSRAEAAADLAPTEQSHAQNMTDRDTAFAMQEHDREELEATELALMRITQGIYGLCLACETEIPITRLLAFPSAMRCIACQTILEKVAGPNAALH
jgi:DnaK suppressor protein